MRISQTMQRALCVVALVGAALAVTPSSNSPVSAAPGDLGAGGEYHPLTPTRIFDSRPASPVNDVAPLGIKPISTTSPTFDVQLLGAGGIPVNPDDVLGVFVSVTVVQPTVTGYLGAYPKGSPPAQATSVVNFNAGDIIPNLAIVRPGDQGKLTVTLFGNPGTAHVVIDVFGWISSSSYAERGARFVSVNPGRIFDSRETAFGASPLGPSGTRRIPIRGADAFGPAVADLVPNNANVVGVVLNVTGIRPTGPTFLSLVPEAPVGTPGTSNLNLVTGQIKANLVTVPVGADGAITLYNHGGNTHVALDVVAYLLEGEPEPTRAGRIVPLESPFRVFDTREPAFGAAPLSAGQAEDWSFANFANSVSIDGVWVGNQDGLFGNLTVASLQRQYPSVPVPQGFLTAYPGGALPTVSNLNMVENTSPVPNMAVLKYSNTTTVRFYNASGKTHYVFDASAVLLKD